MSTTLTPTIEIAGKPCWENRQGHYVPLTAIEPYEILKEETISPLIEDLLWAHDVMADLKARGFEDIETLEDICFEKHGVKLAGQKKNNVSLYRYGGSAMLQRRYQDRTRFNENIAAAEEKIREFLADLKGDINADAKALIETLISRRKEGEVRRSILVQLRSLKFDDERWRDAMQIIAEAEEVIDSACYLSVHRRNEQGKYIPVPLDFAAITPKKSPAPILGRRERGLLAMLRRLRPIIVSRADGLALAADLGDGIDKQALEALHEQTERDLTDLDALLKEYEGVQL